MKESGLDKIRQDIFHKGTVYCSACLDDWQGRGLLDDESRKSIEQNNDRIMGKTFNSSNT